jgi:predicted enzyme related to lactoylglutathione lyase
MATILGVEGIYLTSTDPKKLREWYSKWLGFKFENWGIHFQLTDRYIGSNPVCRAFDDSTYIEGMTKDDLCLGLVVDNIDQAIQQVTEGGAEMMGGIEEVHFGRLCWFWDPHGNKVELWERNN